MYKKKNLSGPSAVKLNEQQMIHKMMCTQACDIFLKPKMPKNYRAFNSSSAPAKGKKTRSCTQIRKEFSFRNTNQQMWEIKFLMRNRKFYIKWSNLEDQKRVLRNSTVRLNKLTLKKWKGEIKGNNLFP